MTAAARAWGRTARAAAAVWVFALVLALSPMTLDPAASPKTLVTAVFAALLAAAMGCRKTARAGGATPRSLYLAVLWLWVLWQGVCAALSPFPENALFSLHVPVFLAVTAAGAGRFVRTPEQLFRWVWAFLVAMTAASVYALCQRLGHDPFPWSTRDVAEYRLLPSSFGNPNIAGHALTLGIAAALVTLRRSPLALLPLAAMLLHLHATRMRGGPLALTAVLVLLVLFFLPVLRRKGAGLRVGGSLAAALLILAAAAGAVMVRNHHREGLWFPSDGSMVLRYNGWYGAAEMFQDHPVTGVGPGNYAAVNAAYWTDFERRWFALKGMKNFHAHNEYLEAAAETGLPGLLLFLCLLAFPVVSGLLLASRPPTSAHRQAGLLAALTATAASVDAVFGFNLHTPVAAGVFFFISGALSGILEEAGAAETVPGPPRRGMAATAIPALALALLLLAAGTLQYRRDAMALWARGLQEWVNTNGGSVGPSDPTALESLKTLDRARNTFPWDSQFSLAEGRLLIAMHQPAAAAPPLEEATRRAPSDPGTWTLLARSLVDSAGRFAHAAGTPFVARRAYEAARRAESLCPCCPDAQEALGKALALQASLISGDAAGNVWRRAALDRLTLALRGGKTTDPGVCRLRAGLALSLHEDAVAAEALSRELSRTPSDLRVWGMLEEVPMTPETAGALFSPVRDTYAALAEARPPNPQARMAAACLLARLSSAAGLPPVFAETLVRETAVALPDHPSLAELIECLPQGAPAEPCGVPEALRRLFPETLPAGLPPYMTAGCGEGPPEAAPEALAALEGALLRHAAALSRPGTRRALQRVLERLVPGLSAPEDARRAQALRERIAQAETAGQGGAR